jgi:hypothetical protein
MIENPLSSFYISFVTGSQFAWAFVLVHVFFLLSFFVFLAANTLFYLINIPSKKTATTLVKLKHVKSSMSMSGILSILRIPFAVIPYFVKVLLYLALRKRFKEAWNSNIFQYTRIMGDILNLGVSFLFWESLLPGRALPLLLPAALAECIRLVLEKGFIVFSILWQHLSLKSISRQLQKFGLKNDWLSYYSLTMDEKKNALQRTVRYWAETDPRFRYFSHFKIVSPSAHLRTGSVRGITHGEIFIHETWLNDPWLCLGICARRSAWIFDPRYLSRPFYYRSQANHFMTEFVLEHASLFPPFAFYQFGHEVKSARFGIFFKWMRVFGLELEEYVQKDGVYLFDPFITYIGHRLGIEERPKVIPIQDDIVAIYETKAKIEQGEKINPIMVAEEFSYPLLYVEEVLWQKVESAGKKIMDHSS